jgi:hypothetical protein
MTNEYFKMTTRTIMVIAALTAVLLPQSSRPQINPCGSKSQGFAPASPESQGVWDESLRSLANTVRGCVERDEIIGAKLPISRSRC